MPGGSAHEPLEFTCSIVSERSADRPWSAFSLKIPTVQSSSQMPRYLPWVLPLYQLTATEPADGDCHETNPSSSAFVQAAILDPATGQISIYNPLVIDQGTVPATGAAPIPPTLPNNAVVALWFGFNGDNLVQQGASPDVLWKPVIA